jgi:hypothetical protein
MFQKAEFPWGHTDINGSRRHYCLTHAHIKSPQYSPIVTTRPSCDLGHDPNVPPPSSRPSDNCDFSADASLHVRKFMRRYLTVLLCEIYHSIISPRVAVLLIASILCLALGCSPLPSPIFHGLARCTEPLFVLHHLPLALSCNDFTPSQAESFSVSTGE